MAAILLKDSMKSDVYDRHESMISNIVTGQF